jgi:hypothetical protein
MRFRAAQPDLMGAVKSLPDKKDPPKRVSVLGDTGQFLRRLSRALYSLPHAIGAAHRTRPNNALIVGPRLTQETGVTGGVTFARAMHEIEQGRAA